MNQHPADRKRLNKVKPNTPLKFIPVQYEKGWRKEQKVEINKTIKRQIQEAKELTNYPAKIPAKIEDSMTTPLESNS